MLGDGLIKDFVVFILDDKDQIETTQDGCLKINVLHH